MSVYEFEGRVPQVHPEAFVHPEASLLGRVTIGEGCWIGPGASLRGDYGEIVVGSGTSIEENCVVHARPGDVTRIGDHVTIGHGAIIHNATVDDWAVIGMGAIVSDWAHVMEWAAVAEGCVVKNRQEIPPKAVAVGVPAKVIGQVTPEYQEEWRNFKATYVDLARRYPKGLKELPVPSVP
ncbi:MAG: gamma carbonic anhydrase family protein [Chloroflexota bacterium]